MNKHYLFFKNLGLEAATLEVITDNKIMIFGGRHNNGDSNEVW